MSLRSLSRLGSIAYTKVSMFSSHYLIDRPTYYHYSHVKLQPIGPLACIHMYKIYIHIYIYIYPVKEVTCTRTTSEGQYFNQLPFSNWTVRVLLFFNQLYTISIIFNTLVIEKGKLKENSTKQVENLQYHFFLLFYPFTLFSVKKSSPIAFLLTLTFKFSNKCVCIVMHIALCIFVMQKGCNPMREWKKNGNTIFFNSSKLT